VTDSADQSELLTPAAGLQRPGAEVAVPPAPARARDVALDLGLASRALSFVHAASGDRADVTATLQMSVVCSGTTAADTLEACAAFLRESPRAELHAIAWARVPGPVRDLTDFQATMTISYADRNGEYSGATDHAPGLVPPPQ
jgi:hypothetical protein